MPADQRGSLVRPSRGRGWAYRIYVDGKRTYKGGFGFHPLHCFLDETGEHLAAVLRPGNAGANTAADHVEVLDAALAQLPERVRGEISATLTSILGRVGVPDDIARAVLFCASDMSMFMTGSTLLVDAGETL